MWPGRGRGRGAGTTLVDVGQLDGKGLARGEDRVDGALLVREERHHAPVGKTHLHARIFHRQADLVDDEDEARQDGDGTQAFAGGVFTYALVEAAGKRIVRVGKLAVGRLELAAHPGIVEEAPLATGDALLHSRARPARRSDPAPRPKEEDHHPAI